MKTYAVNVFILQTGVVHLEADSRQDAWDKMEKKFNENESFSFNEIGVHSGVSSYPVEIQKKT